MPYPYTEKDALNYINFILSSDPHDTFAYAIDMDGVAVGSIGAFRKENIHYRTAEIGYYLAEDYWGKGIMKCNAVKNGQILDMALYGITDADEYGVVRLENSDDKNDEINEYETAEIVSTMMTTGIL